MKSLDRFEREILGAYEKGILVSARPTKAQLAAFREAARATFVKNKRVNIRLSASDLMDPSSAGLRGRSSVPDPDRQCAAQVRHGAFARNEVTSNHALNMGAHKVSARRLASPLGLD